VTGSFTNHAAGIRRGLLLVPAVCALWAAIGPAPCRAVETLSVEQVVKQKDRWASYAQSGLAMRIEGRYSSFAPTLLRFQGCDLNCVWHVERQPFPKVPPSRGSRTIEVSGRFSIADSGKPQFSVESVQELPTDSERLRRGKLALVEAPASDWYALAGWAAARARFYNDADLAREARQLSLEGLSVERRGLKDDAIEAKLALAKKFSDYGLSDADRIEFIHETFARRWPSLDRNNIDEVKQFLARMRPLLPGCEVSLSPADAALRERYEKNPIAVYRAAGPNLRPRLHRVLYSDALMAYLELWGQQKQNSPLELASRIELELPEFKQKAEAIRTRELNNRLASVATISRQEVLELAAQFAARGEDNKALEAKRTWVRAKEERLRKEGRPNDLVQAALEHESLLGDKETAAQLLIQAYEKAPNLKEVSDHLARLGWRNIDGKWLAPGEAAARPADRGLPVADAGSFAGMSRDQLRKVLGEPDSVTRIVTANQLNEVWIYNQNAKSSLSIHFLGPTGSREIRAVRLVQ
jgi:hypothetical protein